MQNVDRIAADYDALEFHVQLDFFLSETSERADVVLPSAVWAEDAGVATNAEGRIVLRHRAADPPGEARPDWWILCEIAGRLGRAERVLLRLDRGRLRGAWGASAGGIADYSGVTYERLEETGGMFWPVPSEDHPGTPRLFEDGRFFFPDGRARFSPVEWGAPTESEDDEYPMLLTTGRTVAHFLSGNQTRRIGTLVEQTPRPWVEVHPSLGFVTGDPVRVVTRRGNITFPALVTDTIRPDTAFVPYHWAKRVAANLLTIDALHPISKICRNTRCAPAGSNAGDVVDASPPPPQAPGSTTPHV